MFMYDKLIYKLMREGAKIEDLKEYLDIKNKP